MVVKPLYTVVIDRAVMGPWWLVEVTGVIVTHCDPMPMHCDVFGPVNGD